MKKSSMMAGLGLAPEEGAEDDDYDYEMTEDSAATESEAAEDEAIDTFLDPELDIETRREAFKRAVSRLSGKR